MSRWSRPRRSIGYVERVPANLAPSRIPLTIVTGPPGGGKSTFVEARIGARDLLICMEWIRDRVRAIPDLPAEEHLSAKLAVRNRMLEALSTDTGHERAWFIVCAADADERQMWASRLGGELVLLAPPLEVCLARIAADARRREDAPDRARWAREWWAANAGLAPTAPESATA